jgi:hypothetical protein
VADRYQRIEEQLRHRHGDDLVDRAVRRIDDGAVSDTAYGWRVSADEELGDDPTRNAYWPKESDRTDSGWWCRCRWGRSNRMCSHVIAVILTIARQRSPFEMDDHD